jgi:PAS domain S-box-containing protein
VSLVERLERLGEILIAISGSPIPTHIFQTLAEQAGTAIACDYMAVCLKAADEDGCVVHLLIGAGRETIPGGPFAMGEGSAGRAIRSGQAVAIDDLSRESGGAFGVEEALTARGLRAALVAPVRRGPEILGALLFARALGVYAAGDVQVASLMAAGVAAALETSRAYQALADDRSTLAAVVRSTQDAVLMINQDGVVLLANPAVRAMLGIEPDAVLGRPLAEVLDHGPLRALLEGGQARISELSLADGRTVQASVLPVSTPYGEAVGLAAILRDITLLKALVQMKNEFVSTVSHDLKNPVLTITGTAELMLEADPGDPRHRAWCSRILKTAQHMAELVGDLLDLGKIESGLEAPGEEVDVVSLVSDVVAALQHQAEAKEMAITVELPDRARVIAHPGRIKQALLNLVGNALKYTQAGGRMRIAVTTTDAELAAGGPSRAVVVTVTDTGVGIRPADLPFVFDKFYRAKTEATWATPGSGLGLAIAKSIIEVHGGRIWVESEEHRGSTFAFSLPAGL